MAFTQLDPDKLLYIAQEFGGHSAWNAPFDWVLWATEEMRVGDPA